MDYLHAWFLLCERSAVDRHRDGNLRSGRAWWWHDRTCRGLRRQGPAVRLQAPVILPHMRSYLAILLLALAGSTRCYLFTAPAHNG